MVMPLCSRNTQEVSGDQTNSVLSSVAPVINILSEASRCLILQLQCSVVFSMPMALNIMKDYVLLDKLSYGRIPGDKCLKSPAGKCMIS